MQYMQICLANAAVQGMPSTHVFSLVRGWNAECALRSWEDCTEVAGSENSEVVGWTLADKVSRYGSEIMPLPAKTNL
jgi:hypothetical protein